MKILDFIDKLEKEQKATAKQLYDVETLCLLKQKAIEYQGEDRMISFEEVAEEVKNEPEEEKIFTGWVEFDKVISGFRPKQLIVVSAYTKQGKTSWLMDMSSRLAECNPTWFLFEQSAMEMMRIFMEKGLAVPHGYTPKFMSGSSVEWIELRIIESIAKFNTKIVFIDQLDFIVPFTASDHALQIGKVMRDLKTIANKWNVVIILICHLKKTRQDVQPTLEDLKGSSSIAQESDTTILIWRENKRESTGEITITNNTMISVQANRRTGKTGNIKMVYHNGRYREQDWVDEEVEKVHRQFTTGSLEEI